MSDKNREELAIEVISYIEKIIMQYNPPEPLPEIGALPGFSELRDYLTNVKAVLADFSAGHFDRDVKLAGATAGLLKTLRGNIRHLTWQCLMVAEGDMSQRVDFMGEFSEAFNSMTRNLAEYRDALEQKQAQLLALTEELKQEIKRKEEVESTLKASEEMYRQKSLRDPLTGIYNRSYFFETVSREIENLKRSHDGHACFMMMDIDHFKAFNDEHGHLYGDQALKMVTSRISRTLRRSDIFARYGGEEFVLFLPDTVMEKGLAIAERIRLSVSERPGPVSEDQPITISIGLAGIKGARVRGKASSSKILLTAISEADSALYAAKASGRDKVCVAADTDVMIYDDDDELADKV